MTASISPENATNQNLTWYSSDEEVITVDANGQITAVAVGIGDVLVSAMGGGGAYQYCEVIVKDTPHTVSDVEGFESAHNYAEDCVEEWIYQSPGAKEIKLSAAILPSASSIR